MITIRRLQKGEADLFRQMRLASLQDAPHAFSSTYESALQRSAESWQEQAEGTTQGGDRATFIAFSGKLPIGIAALYRLEDHTDVGEILQVWIGPDYRGTRVAWDLLDAIFKWAGENNFRRILAGVTQENDRTLSFYTRYGFSPVEASSPDVAARAQSIARLVRSDGARAAAGRLIAIAQQKRSSM